MKKMYVIFFILLGLFVGGCGSNSQKKEKADKTTNKTIELSNQQVEQLVKLAYPYVAMYNVNNKFALAEAGMTTKGYNKGLKNTQLLDHTVKAIARPNNDVLYQMAMLDLRKDAAVFEFPAMSSKYVSLMATGYDHYVNVPLSTTKGDFKNPTTIMFYTQRTQHFNDEPIEGVNEVFEMTGDFVSLVLRVAPHANDPEKYQKIVEQIGNIKGMSLSEYLGEEKIPDDAVDFPKYGETDANIFENNLLEVLQFVFNHTTFDRNNAMDKAMLDAYKPLGIEPGKAYNAAEVMKIDGKQFRVISLKIKEEELAKMNKPEVSITIMPQLFQAKGHMTLEPMLLQSVVGPIGLPITEAMYPPVVTADGTPMNAMHDYVIAMSKEELPPARAFWSLTLYDTENGFFIPNDAKKYSVGENAGMKLDAKGGLKVYVSTAQPKGVPAENWLPINREDIDLDIILRIYAPDLEKMKTWEAPRAEMIK